MVGVQVLRKRVVEYCLFAGVGKTEKYFSLSRDLGLFVVVFSCWVVFFFKTVITCLAGLLVLLWKNLET